MKRIGVDVGGTFTDLVLVDEEAGRVTVDKVPSTPDDPSRGVIAGIRGLCQQGRRRPGRGGQPAARHDDRHQYRAHPLGRRGGPDHDRGLPRHPPHRAAQEAVQLLAAAGAALAVAAAGQAPPSAHGQGARHRPRRGGADAARRRGGARARAAAEGGRCRGGLGLPAALLPEPGSRAPHQGDRARGVPGGVPLGFPRGAAPLPRVRALLDRVLERVRRPEGRALRGPLRCGAAGGGLSSRRPAHAVLRRDGHGGVRYPAARQHAHVRARRRSDRRHLGGQDGRARERRDPGHGRHLGGHRRRRRRAATHAPPARHEDRRLPGDGAHGRHRHDRRRRRLDRLRRRGRRLPRRASVRRSGPRARLLRTRRHRSHLDRCAARARPPAARPGPARRRHAARSRACARQPSRRSPIGSA